MELQNNQNYVFLSKCTRVHVLFLVMKNVMLWQGEGKKQ